MLAYGSEVSTTVSGDPLRLRQVLNNLLVNALKFTHSGEVILRVFIRANRTTTVVFRFEVRDTGIGIPQAAQAGLFTFLAGRRVDHAQIWRDRPRADNLEETR